MRVLPIHPWEAIGPRPRNLAAGVWRLVDPKIALASLVPFVVGIALAFDPRSTMDWPLAAGAFAAIFLVEVGKNAVNDLYDFASGADMNVLPEERSPFSGGKRVLVEHLLTENDLVAIAWIAFGLAGLIGIEVATRSRPELLVLGAIAALISILYAMPPVKLASRGFGELAVMLVYGPGIVLGTVLLLRGSITVESIVASIALGFLIANVLLINEVPDERADRVAGKRTLIVRAGRDRAPSLIAIMFSLAFALPVAGAMYGFVPLRMCALLSGIPTAVVATSLLRRTPFGPPVAAQAMTLVTYVIAGAAYAGAVFASY